MSTDFLNRRMDLIHTIDVKTVSGETTITPGGGSTDIGTIIPGGPIGPEVLNILTMDTSYPVRLAGKVIKIFTAYRTWTTRCDWVIKNAKGNKILNIPFGRVYDFAGRAIDENVGADKFYNKAEDVYKQGDYVMVIIDFDNATLHLCSETNFSVFITGDSIDKESFKLFDIAGEDKVTFNNQETLLNKEVMKAAIEFDNEEGHHSFIRNGSDNVVYQLPKENTSDESITAIPVSDVDITNINSFNASCYPLLFPNINTGYRESFEIIDSCRNFVQLSGVVNSEFIKKFCYTVNELINLPIIEYEQTDGGGGNIKSKFMDTYLVYYISNIFKEGKQNDYVYFIRDFADNSDLPKFETSAVRQSQVIVPIHIDTSKFSEIDAIMGNKELCNGNKYELNLLNNFTLSGNIIGNWWGTAFNNNSVWVYSFSNSGNPNFYGFMIRNEGPYTLYDFGSTYTLIYQGNTPTNNYISHSIDYNSIMNTDNFSDIKRLITYFSNGDEEYKNYIYKNILSNNHSYGAMVYTTGESPVSSAFMCTEDLYNHILKDEDTASSEILKTYSQTLSAEQQNGLKYFSSVNIDNIDSDELKALAFKMFFFSKDEINDDIAVKLNYSNMAFPDDNFRKVGDKKFKFKVSNDFLPNSKSHNASITFINNKPYMCHFLSRALPRAIDNGYGELEDYLIADVGITRTMFVSRPIFFANENNRVNPNTYLIFDDTGNLYYHNDMGEFELKFVKRINSGVEWVPATFNNLKTELAYNNTTYLYYADSNESYFRIRLFVDGDTFNSKWATWSVDNKGDIFTHFDYFTEPLMILKTIDPNDDKTILLYDRAYCNCMGIPKANLTSISAWERITMVAAKYYIASRTIWFNLKDGDLISQFAAYDDTVGNNFEQFSTISLSIDLDYSMYYYRHNGTINGRDFKISDLIPENTFTYTDGPAPLLSMTKNKDTFVYNVESYQDFISNVYVANTTSGVISNITSNEGGIIEPLLNKHQLKYINGKGIRPEYYENVSIYDFFRYMALYDLAIPMQEQAIDTNSDVNMAIYNKNTFDNIHGTEIVDGKTYLVDSNNKRVVLKSDIIILCKINNDNRYGFNEVSIIDNDNRDVTSNYIISDKIYASIEKAGNKKVMNIALSNKDNILLNINGILGNLNRDKLNWETLLLALSNNKSIDILSNSLIDTKKSLNAGFLSLGQNVNDTVSIENNDSPESYQADFDNYYNVYRYKPKEGYTNKERVITNRGVIVFVTDGGSNSLNTHGHDTDSTRWTEDVKESELHAKRMYISKDGLLCTKEYYDREAASSSDTTTTIKELEERIKALEEKLK